MLTTTEKYENYLERNDYTLEAYSKVYDDLSVEVLERSLKTVFARTKRENLILKAFQGYFESIKQKLSYFFIEKNIDNKHIRVIEFIKNQIHNKREIEAYAYYNDLTLFFIENNKYYVITYRDDKYYFNILSEYPYLGKYDVGKEYKMSDYVGKVSIFYLIKNITYTNGNLVIQPANNTKLGNFIKFFYNYLEEFINYISIENYNIILHLNNNLDVNDRVTLSNLLKLNLTTKYRLIQDS